MTSPRQLLRGGGRTRGRGRVQKAVRRALLAAGGEATTTVVLDWVYVRRRLRRRWFPTLCAGRTS
jgi:hypothetical protein